MEEKLVFEQFCEGKGLKPGQMLRHMLARVCPGEIMPGDRSEKVLKDAPLYLRLSKSEVAEIRQRAQPEGITPQDWVRKLVRTALHNTPQFTRDEENALLQSNRELAHLGRNINQIAHQLNISLSETDQINAARLEALAKSIESHREKVSSLINASWGRYGGMSQ
jgi:hypothetical protein